MRCTHEINENRGTKSKERMYFWTFVGLTYINKPQCVFSHFFITYFLCQIINTFTIDWLWFKQTTTYVLQGNGWFLSVGTAVCTLQRTGKTAEQPFSVPSCTTCFWTFIGMNRSLPLKETFLLETPMETMIKQFQVYEINKYMCIHCTKYIQLTYCETEYRYKECRKFMTFEMPRLTFFSR